ncbi:hypothetical protein GOP47_0022833 [Adiantum capillus-veneris]|uniref:RRM domain-containing protein n=1 Tax=Adiantum capillus-veneris TaxID=13818 RepID=A0A9D4U833_ADICA|nr:hypothetical protein GOP47_0022833 [Adiantum capillus-veneris]
MAEVAPSPPLPMEQQLRPPPPPLPPQDSPTLLVKHLPDALPLDTLKHLFSHYGASNIRPCIAAKMKNCAFVEFKEEAQAARAQAQLHRLRFLGKVLAVERAKPFTSKISAKDQTEAASQSSNLVTLHDGQRLPSSMSYFETGPTRLGLRHEPIAPSLGIDYPFPPHLEYAYPPPDGNILTNIVNALIAVPGFYTQVLHLMNKMNLPAPFRPALPTPPLPPPPPEPVAPSCPGRDLSSDESELESAEEMGAEKGEEVGTHELGTKKRKSRAKEVEEAKPTSLVPAERPLIKKNRPVLQIKITSKGHSKDPIQSEGDKVPEERMNDSGAEESVAVMAESTEPRNAATRDELIAGRMPSNELFALPMCKNYTRGAPTAVLYIKNLAKDVAPDDLYFIFGAVFGETKDFRSQLGIKLMQEGRMRGQAFVDFPSAALAEDALNMTHGYMLKGKPMVVQFGRNPAAGKTSAL